MSKQPKVSVIIPVYNTEQFLRECLDSVVNQTLRDIEIICVDDGSTDGSLAILREYEARDKRVRVLTQQNINAGAARNHGLRYAEGEYLSFLDADDFFEPDMLETAFDRATEYQADIIVFRSDDYYSEDLHVPIQYAVRRKNLPIGDCFAGVEIERDLFGSFVGWTWDKLFSARFIRESGLKFQIQRTTNDLLFTYAALAKAERIAVMDQILTHHRRGVKTSLESTREKSWYCSVNALLALKAQLSEWGLYTRFEQDFVNYSLSFTLWNLDTLRIPEKKMYQYMLRTTWYDQLNVLGRDRDYFYSVGDYQRYQTLMADHSELAFVNGAVKNRASWSYRIGCSTTWLLRKIRGGVRCLRENGLRYTLLRAREKMRRGLRR